jgi:choline kinase
MQVIILAAGKGIRLKDLTHSKPKALVEVSGHPLLYYALRFARQVGAQRLVVVGGYGHREVAQFVHLTDPDVIVVENPRFEQGNLLSLRAGLACIDPALGWLHMNSDHIYQPAIADVVRKTVETAQELTGFCDFDRTLGADDMKIALDEQRRISAISKQLSKWDAGYVGMTCVPSSRALDYVETIPNLLDRLGESIHVESVLAHFATTTRRPAISDISGFKWMEIDEPHERARAEEVLSHEQWWPVATRPGAW